MMIQRLLRKRRTLAAAASAALFASAFQTGGCTFNLDESLLQSLTSLLENAGSVRFGPGGVHIENHGPGHDGDGGDTEPGDMEEGPDQPV